MNAQATSHRHFHDELSEAQGRAAQHVGRSAGGARRGGGGGAAAGRRQSESGHSRRQGDRHLELEVEETVIGCWRPSNPWPATSASSRRAMKISTIWARRRSRRQISAQSAERLLASRPIVPEPECRDGTAGPHDARRRARRVRRVRRAAGRAICGRRQRGALQRRMFGSCSRT